MTLGEPCYPDNEGASHCCEKQRHICFSNKLCFDTTFNHVIDEFDPNAISAATTDHTYRVAARISPSKTLPVPNTVKVA